MSGGTYGGRSPPRPHLFGGSNFPVVSEEGNTSILRSNVDQEQEDEFSLFAPKFLQEVANMKEKNLADELLKKLIAEQVSVYRRTNVVKSEKFSEIMQRSLNAYLNGMLTNEEVIEEILKLAKQIAAAQQEGDKLGLTVDELAFTTP